MQLCLWLVLLSIFVVQLCNSYDEMQDMMSQYMERSQQKRAKPNRKWFKYIQCQVCEEAVKQLTRQSKIFFESTPRHEISEESIHTLMEKVCNPYTDEEGIWITRYDLVLNTTQGKLHMKSINIPDAIGHCGQECETIAYACNKIFEDHDIELSELLYSNPSRSNVRNILCPSYCKREKKITIKNTPKNSHIGKEKWREADFEQRQMVKVAASMPGNVKMLDPSAMMFDDMHGGDMENMYDYDSLYAQPPNEENDQEPDASSKYEL